MAEWKTRGYVADSDEEDDWSNSNESQAPGQLIVPSPGLGHVFDDAEAAKQPLPTSSQNNAGEQFTRVRPIDDVEKESFRLGLDGLPSYHETDELQEGHYEIAPNLLSHIRIVKGAAVLQAGLENSLHEQGSPSSPSTLSSSSLTRSSTPTSSQGRVEGQKNATHIGRVGEQIGELLASQSFVSTLGSPSKDRPSRTRNLRHRNPIQLHPYAIEQEKYRQVLQNRGVKPLRIAQGELHFTRAPAEDSQGGEFTADAETQDPLRAKSRSSSASSLASRSDPASQPQNALQDTSLEESELPDMDAILRFMPAHIAYNEHKRRKIMPSSSGQGRRTGFKASHTVTADLDGAHVDIPPSPPGSWTQKSPTTSRSDTRGFRFPRGVSPIALPTPATSSEPRQQPVLMADDAQSDSSLPANMSSENESEASSSESEKRTHKRVIRVERKIRGVLPASWLKLDLLAQAKSTAKESRRTASPSPEKDTVHQRGVARLIAPQHKAHKTSDTPIHILDSSSEVDSEEEPRSLAPLQRPSDSTNKPNQCILSITEDLPLASLWGEVAEDNRIDTMAPTTTRQRRTARRGHQIKSSVKQTSLTDMHMRRQRQTKIDRTPDMPKSIRNDRSRLFERGARPQRLKFRPPDLSLLDVPSPSTSSTGPRPSFIRIARRTVRSRNDRGKSVPDRKYLRLATNLETEEANEYLRFWREGTLQPKTTNQRSNTMTVANVREPLQPCAGNNNAAPDSNRSKYLQPRLNMPTKAQAHSKLVKPPRSRSIQTSLDRIIELGPRNLQQPAARASRQVQRNSDKNQARKDSARSGQLVSSLKASGHSRPAALESLQANIGCERPQSSFRRQLNFTGQHVAPDATTNPLLAKFLEDEDVPINTVRLAGVAQADSITPGIPSPGSRSRRPRKRRPQQLNLQVYRPSLADAINTNEADFYQRRNHAEATVVQTTSLTGLGLFGTIYTTSFDIAPLPIGSYFTTGTFLGNGEFARSFIVSGLDQARGFFTTQSGPYTFRWGPWNDYVSTQLGSLIDQACEGLQQTLHQNEEASACTIDGIIHILGQIVRYFSTNLSFYDSIDRTSFLQRCKALISRLIQELPSNLCGINRLDEHGLGNLRKSQSSTIRALNLCVVVASQLQQISKHHIVSQAMQADVMGLLEQSAVRVLSYVFDGQSAGFIQTRERCRKSGNGPVVFEERHVAVETLVLVSHTLAEANSIDVLWTGLRSSVALPPLEAIKDARILEVRWEKMFLILPFLEIDRQGVLEVGRRHKMSCEDWTAVKGLLEPVLEACRSNTERQASTVNSYCRAIMGRCFTLINTWGWRKCESIIGVLFDFFARRSLNNLPNEEAHGSPHFLANLDQQPLLELAAEDRCFHVFLKIIGSGLRGMRRVYPDKKIGGIVWRLLPNHGRFLPKDQAISQVDLDALRNHHDLLCTLYWASPPGFRPKPAVIQDLVDVESSHKEACRINIRAWSNLVTYQITANEPLSSLEPFVEWLNDLLTQTVRQHQRARTEAEEQVKLVEATKGYIVNRSLLESTISQNQRQVEAILSDLICSMQAVIKIAPDLETAKTLLSPEIASIFRSIGIRLSQTTRIITYVLELLLVFCIKALPQDQVIASNDNDDSQDYGDWSAFRSVVLPTAVTTYATAEYLIKHFLDPLRQLLSNCFGAEIPPEDAFLTKVIDTWVAMSRVQVFEGMRSWDDYIGDYGYDSWASLRDTEQTRKFLSYYLSVLVDSDRVVFKEHKQYVLIAWAASLVERESLLKYQHRLTCSLLNADSSDSILANPPFWARAGRFEITPAEFSERRLALIMNVLSNMRKSMEDAGGSEAMDLRANYKEILKVIMSSMQSNYQELGQASNFRGAYVEFVHRVVELLQQYTASICPIDRFFTDSSSFPLPADDPTYVVGQLKNYGLRLHDHRTPKQLAMFVQSVSERAALDGQQVYLVSQLSTAMGSDGGRDVLGLSDLRSFLIKIIFPAYVDIALGTTCGWIMAVPILQATQTVFSCIMTHVNGANATSVISMSAMIIDFFDCLRQSLNLLVDHPHNLEQPNVLKTVAAYFAIITSVLPALDYLCRISRSYCQADNLMRFFKSIALFAAQSLLGHTDIEVPNIDPMRNMDNTNRQHTDVQAFTLHELRETLNRNWIYHEEQYYVNRGQTRREVVVDIGLFEEERDGVIKEIEGFFNVLGRMTVLGKGKEV
ncbi:MAG: hypothetical protein Q9209_002443 [Squamulea sp. 1 TL-2023]